MKIGYYPGCSLQGSSREYDESFRAIAPLLGLELQEIPDWNCCGASAAHNMDRTLSMALPARVLALAEAAGMKELLVPCSACYARLATCAKELGESETLRAQVSELIEMKVLGNIDVLNALEALGRVPAQTVESRVVQPFQRRVACYYGCYLVRPPKVTRCERYEDPQSMDDLVRHAGAQPLDWAFKTECCGAGLSVSRTDLVGKLSAKILADATRRGAEAIVVACPMCHTNFDLRRDAINRRAGTNYAIPVLYISQLLGLAFGLNRKELGLLRHNVPVKFEDNSTQPVPVVVAPPPVPHPNPPAKRAD